MSGATDEPEDSDGPGDPSYEKPTDLVALRELLDRCNAWLEEHDRRLLIGLDEYEEFDRKIGEGVFTVDLLGAFRSSIQAHRRITWIYTGSHEIDELTNAVWPSFLVSTRTVEVKLFSPQETHTLLTDPVSHAKQWRGVEENRPRFPVEFWGTDREGVGGIERIYRETIGWPHLVQALAETCSRLVIDAETDRISPDLLERAIEQAVDDHTNVLSLLVRYESELPGEYDYLLGFRQNETQPPPSDPALHRSLRRRMMVEETEDGQWRMKVPLMRRWLIARG